VLENVDQKSKEEINLVIKRRRWANVGAIYLLLLVCSIFFMGPLLFGAISSLKDNPTEWPPSIKAEQLSPKNWVGAFRTAQQGGAGGFFGELKAGHELSFEATYKYSTGETIVVPQVIIPKRVGGTGRRALDLDRLFAADFVEIKPVEEVSRTLENGIK